MQPLGPAHERDALPMLDGWPDACRDTGRERIRAEEMEGAGMNDPDLWTLLLTAFFPGGIPPHQFENLAVLMYDINELYDLHDQIQRTEKKHNSDIIICTALHDTARKDATLRNGAEVKKEVTKRVTQSTPEVDIKSLQNNHDISSKPYIIGAYPINFEESPIGKTKKRMGRPPREPGSSGFTCPKCGSINVTLGGYGPNKERRIRCKDCGSQPIAEEANYPIFNDKIDERILALEFEDHSPDEISERLKADGATIPAADIEARLKELHEVPA